MESRIHEFGCWFTSIKEERFLYIMNGEGSVCFFCCYRQDVYFAHKIYLEEKIHKIIMKIVFVFVVLLQRCIF